MGGSPAVTWRSRVSAGQAGWSLGLRLAVLVLAAALAAAALTALTASDGLRRER